MSVTKWKIELKLKCENHYDLSVAGADNDDAKPNNIFLLSKTQNYVSIVTLLAKDNKKQDNKKLSKLFSKDFEKAVYCQIKVCGS